MVRLYGIRDANGHGICCIQIWFLGVGCTSAQLVNRTPDKIFWPFPLRG